MLALKLHCSFLSRSTADRRSANRLQMLPKQRVVGFESLLPLQTPLTGCGKKLLQGALRERGGFEPPRSSWSLSGPCLWVSLRPWPSGPRPCKNHQREWSGGGEAFWAKLESSVHQRPTPPPRLFRSPGGRLVEEATARHRVLTEKIFPRQAEVLSADDFAARIGGG